jgi:hypothetical protein
MKHKRLLQGIGVLMLMGMAVLAGCASAPPSEDGIIVPLDRAIREAVAELKTKLAPDTTVSVDIKSGSNRFDTYVKKEMEILLAGGAVLVKETEMTDDLRKRLMDELYAGYVSDETAQSIGQELGTQVVVIGDLFSMSHTYHIWIRAVVVKEMIIGAGYSADIHPKEWKVRDLMGNQTPPPMKLPPVVKTGAEERSWFPGWRGKSVSFIIVNPSVVWGDGGVSFAFNNMLELYFSLWPYTSIGIGFLGLSFLWNSEAHEEGAVRITFLPLYAGTVIPVTRHIDFFGYGFLDIGVIDGEEFGGLFVQEGSFFMSPGIKTGITFYFGGDSTEKMGMDLFYTGEWFAEGKYVNSVGVGLRLTGLF